MTNVLAVAAGGAIGAAGRYLLTGLSRRFLVGEIPVGTLVVNWLGCLLIGFLVPWMLEARLVRPEVRNLVLVGVLGGLTTFSTFAYETFEMLEAGQPWRAALNFALHNGIGIALVWWGYRLGAVSARGLGGH